jgi:hypothetical protein
MRLCHDAPDDRLSSEDGTRTGRLGTALCTANLPVDVREPHPVEGEEPRRGLADPVRPERPQDPTAGVIPAGQHQPERIHPEQARFIGSA